MNQELRVEATGEKKWKNRIVIYLLLTTVYILLGTPAPVFAHAFGQQYILPVPFSLYAYGSAFVLLVSFILLGFFFGQSEKNFSNSRIALPEGVSKFFLNNTYLHLTLKIVTLSFFILAILTGL